MHGNHLAGLGVVAGGESEHVGQRLLDDDTEGRQQFIVGAAQEAQVKAHVRRHHGLGIRGISHALEGCFELGQLFWRAAFSGENGSAGFENAAYFLQRDQEVGLVHGGAVPGHDITVEQVPAFARLDP